MTIHLTLSYWWLLLPLALLLLLIIASQDSGGIGGAIKAVFAALICLAVFLIVLAALVGYHFASHG